MDSCVCLDVFDDDVPCEIIKQEQRKARKQHRCYECNDIIKVGETYTYTLGVCDGLFSHKICIHCKAMRDEYFKCGYYFGNIWIDLIDSIEQSMTKEEKEEDPNWADYILPRSLIELREKRRTRKNII